MIKKEYKAGMLNIQARISDGFAVLVTNQPQVTKQIYEQTKREGKPVAWNQRVQACTQYYPNKTAEEILVIVDAEVEQAKKDGKVFAQAVKK